MQVLLHSDPNTDGSHLMAEHLSSTVKEALGRFGERVTRIEAHLSDVNGQAKTGSQAIHCTLEARLIGLDNIVVKDHADSAHQAIDGAVRKLKRALDTGIAKHDDRHPRPRHEAPATDTDSDGDPAA
jgi:ribosome-associated translation inhibitor RaiA